MFPPDFVAACVRDGKINFNLSAIGVAELELILTVLQQRGNVQIVNARGTMSLIELGAYLNAIAK